MEQLLERMNSIYYLEIMKWIKHRGSVTSTNFIVSLTKELTISGMTKLLLLQQ